MDGSGIDKCMYIRHTIDVTIANLYNSPVARQRILTGEQSHRRAFFVPDAWWKKLEARSRELGKTTSEMLRDLIRKEIGIK